MYGTVARLRPKAGHQDEILSLGEMWKREVGPNADGFVATFLFQPDGSPDENVLLVVFEDREYYLANANNPHQERWFQRLREHLEGDPVWEDGEVIASEFGARPEPTV